MINKFILFMICLCLHTNILLALADPSHEIEEASDKQKLEALYKKKPHHCPKIK